MNDLKTYHNWMLQAIEQANLAYKNDEVPVGAVVVRNDQLLGAGFNSCIGQNDPTAHAEVQAIRQACQELENYRLDGAVLYVTVEPCLMCLGTIVHARIDKVVFGTKEPKAGALLERLTNDTIEYGNHSFTVVGGVLADQCQQLMSSFFESKR